MLHEQHHHGRALVERLDDWQTRLPEAKGIFQTFAEGEWFVWWPSLWHQLSGSAREQVLLDFITKDRLAHRGEELSTQQWERIQRTLPGVRPLAGTFASQSGPNCLGTTLAAFGIPNMAELWLHGGPFERWLEAVTVASSELDALGTILVWRDAAGRVQHAGVALGEGWLFHKEAQSWSAPRQIVGLSEALRRWDEPGWRVTSYMVQS
ncbi:hypothetical protein [Deinococcus sp. QL22]|uniref:hypothetical protein n=1 Tax=Deinococcus sp. QL22 TaxID=2939437 RepID=UPI002016D40F|nr:hypothetical protein [Deinococcus sp. QL22]UQN10601.1 hypothetical protein M1R55_30875 [Deinococcus sp. QL22]